MKTRAAVAFEAKKPLEIVEVDLEGPKAGEGLVEIKATGICHTDAYTLDGFDSEGIFPSILGHEGAGIVRDVGPGVTSVKAGDHVIPLYTPECRQCKSCLSQKTNLCTAIRATQGKGLMPDGTSRFSYKGQTIYHYMGCSTFSNFTVLPEIAVAKIRTDAPFDTSCYIGCGVTTGVGAGFYVDATEAPWATHYRMWSYITDELPALVAAHFPVDIARQSITGHSMGGHGALTIGLSFPDRYRAVSAFAPIVAPSQVPWGEKALGGYLGADRAAWRRHDAVALIEDGARVPALLVDQGEADQFLAGQLRPELLAAACEKAGIPLTLRM